MRSYMRTPKATGQTPALLPRRSDAPENLPAGIGNQAALRLLKSRADRLRARSGRPSASLFRQAAGPGPAFAPPIVQEALRDNGQPIPDGIRREMEELLGRRNLADVRIHTGERAAASAEAVAAEAYTVGRRIVFAPGRFEPESNRGRRLLAHELSHAADHPPGLDVPSGDLRISGPDDPGEKRAFAAAEGFKPLANASSAAPRLFRQPAPPVALTGISVNHDKVTVPPVPGLSFSASKTPSNAPGVTLSVVGDNAVIAAGTTINNTTGVITVAAAQTGGSAHVEASQNASGPGGTISTTSPAMAPFNFTAIPAGIASTSASPSSSATDYGGSFVHTFKSPAGGPAALEFSHVNEIFPGASGGSLTITGTMGSVTVQINNPNSAADGWDLDASGKMSGPDDVGWSNSLDARPFVANASNPAPSPALPQALTATQNFRNLTFPNQTYGAATVATTTHRRAFEDRGNRLKAVTSAGVAQEVVQDYAGPTVFRHCRANPASIPVAPPPASPGAPAAVAATSKITVDAEGQTASPTFTIRPPELGCTISSSGILTPGTTAGKVTVRAGDAANFDETTVTITPRP